MAYACRCLQLQKIESFPLVLQAALWGGVAGGALLLGACAAYFLHLSDRISGTIMTLGVGVLFPALTFDLMAEAFERGGRVSGGLHC